jgi:hypothetical protein
MSEQAVVLVAGINFPPLKATNAPLEMAVEGVTGNHINLVFPCFLTNIFAFCFIFADPTPVSFLNPQGLRILNESGDF